ILFIITYASVVCTRTFLFLHFFYFLFYPTSPSHVSDMPMRRSRTAHIFLRPVSRSFLSGPPGSPPVGTSLHRAYSRRISQRQRTVFPLRKRQPPAVLPSV